MKIFEIRYMQNINILLDMIKERSTTIESTPEMVEASRVRFKRSGNGELLQKQDEDIV